MSRRTSPKGSMLERGEETRKIILSCLPGTFHEIAHMSDINYTSVKHAVRQMVLRGEVESVDVHYPREGGPSRQVWGRSKPPPDNRDNPWHNAWYERR